MTSYLEICRLCLNKQDLVSNIFDYKNGELPAKIKTCTTIQVSKSDSVCSKCVNAIIDFYEFRKLCLQTDRIFRNGNRNESNLETLTAAQSSSFKTKFGCREVKGPVERNSKIKIYEIDDVIRSIIGTNIYVCDICTEQFTSFFEYQDHQDVHDGTPMFKCDKCSELFTSRKCLVEHDSRHKVSCHICKLEILPKSMSAHVLIHTDAHKCVYCGLRHTSNASLEKHVKARHTGIKGFVCHICGKQNSCQSSMNRHMAYHNTERPFKCKYCTFCAKSLNIVQVHTARKHFAEKCVCDICAKLFKSKLSLLQHVKRIHSVHKHFCNVCNKAFIEKYNLKRHLKKHEGQRLHECKVCQKEFFTVRLLKEHMHSHREGCVNCPKCEKEFYYKKYYNKHILKCSKSEAGSENNYMQIISTLFDN